MGIFGDDDRTLRVVGLVQVGLGTVADQLPQVFTQGLGGLAKGLLHYRKGFVHGGHHADRLRTLAGEYK